MIVDDELYRCAETEPVLTWVARRPGSWLALMWAPVLLLGPIVDSLITDEILRTLSVILLSAVYAITVWLPFGIVTVRARRRWVSEVVFLLFMAACTTYLVVWQVDREFIFALLAIAAAVAVRPGWALSIVFAIAISAA